MRPKNPVGPRHAREPESELDYSSRPAMVSHIAEVHSLLLYGRRADWVLVHTWGAGVILGGLGRFRDKLYCYNFGLQLRSVFPWRVWRNLRCSEGLRTFLTSNTRKQRCITSITPTDNPLPLLAKHSTHAIQSCFVSKQWGNTDQKTHWQASWVLSPLAWSCEESL